MAWGAKKATVVILTNKRPSQTGGIERFLGEFAAAAGRRGVVVTFHFLQTPREQSRIVAMDTDVQVNAIVDAQAAVFEAEAERLVRRVRSHDLVLLAGSAPMFVRWSEALQTMARLIPAKVVVSLLFPMQELEFYFGPRLTRRYAAAIEPVLNASHAVAVPSEFSRTGLLQYCSVSTAVHRVPLAAVSGDEETIDEAFDSTQAVLISTVSSFTVHKNVDVAMEAWPHVRAVCPMARLVVVGMGSDGLPKTDGVQCLGHVAEYERRRAVRNSAVLIQLSAIEAFGLATVEALAAGTPVVALDAGATPEIVNDQENGCLLRPYSVFRRVNGEHVEHRRPTSEDLSQAVVRMFTDPTRRRELSRKARAAARPLTWGRLVERYLTLLP